MSSTADVGSWHEREVPSRGKINAETRRVAAPGFREKVIAQYFG
jgi:hypothetical protein